MTKPDRTIAYDAGGLFRVEHQTVGHRDTPYEFVRRIGAVTILPIVSNPDGSSDVLTIRNVRTHYGTIFEIPGGNIDGRFSQPETPEAAAARELQEETGYRAEGEGGFEVFRMREISRSILYPRYFAVARNLAFVGGTIDSFSEQITIEPTPLDQYLDTLLDYSRGEAYPEVTLAFAKAVAEFGRQDLQEWITTGSSASPIPASFSPWLLTDLETPY